MSGIPATTPGAAGVHGVGPRTPLVTERFPFVSDFVSAVGAAASGAGITGGTFGAPENLRRYCVGGFADARVLRANPGRARAQAAALLFAEENRQALSRGFVLGFWADANGRLWLDVSYCYGNAGEAFTAAQDNGELAVWDRDDVRELTV